MTMYREKSGEYQLMGSYEGAGPRRGARLIYLPESKSLQLEIQRDYGDKYIAAQMTLVDFVKHLDSIGQAELWHPCMLSRDW